MKKYIGMMMIDNETMGDFLLFRLYFVFSKFSKMNLSYQKKKTQKNECYVY